MAVIGREFAPVFVQFINRRLTRRLARMDACFGICPPRANYTGRTPPLHYPMWCAAGARNHMIKGQLIGGATILAGKAVAQKTLNRVKAGCLGGFT